MSAYADILRTPPMARLFSAMVLARLPLGINGLALVLYVRDQGGSFAVAGATAGALALGSGVGAPIGGRLVDRLGARVLLALAALHAAGLAGIVASGAAGAPAGALIALSALAGLAFPPTSSVLRTQYGRLLHSPGLVQGAFALDSVLTESIFILGPLLTAAMVAFVSPGAALLLSAGAVLAGAVAFQAALPEAVRDERGHAGTDGGRLGALRAPGIRTLVLSMLPVGFALGALEVAIPAFADGEGRPHLAGVLIAIWSIGSAAGGLVYGARPRRTPLLRVHLVAAVLVPAALAPVLLATSPLAMALLVIPAGVFIAPLIATRNELAGTVAPAGAETEAFTWPITALVSGVALGAAAAGGLIDAGSWRTAVLAGVAAGALGAAISFARRGTLVSAAG